eukprot:TRINITY_DN29515_c0_g1_i2.p1 TRINITY_DN29515_c0_g1~~TRINITY_DN29515_c0_g1_i2.p1  ORF type:complete len:284 (-),score=25.80 TRINITY_DN29515_c0_g1_i2:260-1111(-)
MLRKQCLLSVSRSRSPWKTSAVVNSAETLEEYERLLLAVLEAYPEAAQEENNGEYPVEAAAKRGVSERVVRALLEAHPQAAKICSKKDRCLPLHWSLMWRLSEGVIIALLEAHPAAAAKELFGADLIRHPGKTCSDPKMPVQVALEFGASQRVVWQLLQLHPHALEGVQLSVQSIIAMARTISGFGDLTILPHLTSADVCSLTDIVSAIDITSMMKERSHASVAESWRVGHEILCDADPERVLNVLRAWHSSVTLRGAFIQRCLSQVLPGLVARDIEQFLFGR